MITFDSFLKEDTYQLLKEHSLQCDFQDINNPIDGVTYPDICMDIPNKVKEEILTTIGGVIGTEVVNPLMFMRMSKEGTQQPHIVHHDLSHGSYSFMLYLNDHPTGGTGLVRHIPSGASYCPQEDVYLQVIEDDMNKPEKWHVYNQSVMKQNSAVIFDAGNLHCALPIGGFGKEQNTSRIVLTMFFSLKGD